MEINEIEKYEKVNNFRINIYWLKAKTDEGEN